MGLEQRPFIGTWSLSNRKVVQHTPDALVYINGDTRIPGCQKCNSPIDIQKFVTQVTVDAGVDPASASANITLSIPTHHLDSLARDGQYVLRPGLEVHVYMRGYFPVAGMYSNFLGSGPAQPTGTTTVNAEGSGGDASFLGQFGMANTDLEKILAYPYYHVFHGVVTSVNTSWQPGSQQVTLQCGSMLHFWNYQLISTNTALLASKPENSNLKSSLIGHNYTSWSPYEIMYDLFSNAVGDAGGIGWALGNETNSDARSPVTGDSLSSSILTYWEKRFNQKEIKLRMHGVTGEIFNTRQAVLLGGLNSSQITAAMRSHYAVGSSPHAATPWSKSDQKLLQAQDLMRQSGGLTDDFFQKLGLTIASQSGDGRGKIDTLVSDQIAFTWDLSTHAEFFESAYQTKADVASTICTLTGFEFYQDVDGDFVFKPPMYNLDTSSSRVYRLDDIDIISINFEEKEPEATYCTVKGGQFTGLQVSSLTNEWGTRGQYIDFRLVAQFGWRPEVLEVSYYNDPKSLFFAAINRLDVLNTRTKTGTVTLPYRPEIRPGYPVYIPYLDCYYYVPSFNHSYTPGGQTTTTLQLVAKRAKFFAPGIPSKAKEGIGAIDLTALNAPAMPLEVDDLDGKRTLAGFPNVVMALDPYLIDPSVLFRNRDINDLSRTETLDGVVKLAVQAGILKEIDNNPGYYQMITTDKHRVTYYFGPDKTPPKDGPKAVSLKDAADAYTTQQSMKPAIQAEYTKKQAALDAKILKAERRIAEIDTSMAEHGTDDLLVQEKDELSAVLGVRSSAPISSSGSGTTLYDQRRFNSAEFEAAMGNDTRRLKDLGLPDLVELVRKTKDAFLRTARGVEFRDLTATTSLLDILSNKKASLTTGDSFIPGSYRYYSASHPDKRMQGQEVVVVTKTGTKTDITRLPPVISDPRYKKPVLTFAKPDAVSSIAGGAKPQAKFIQSVPQWGIKIQGSVSSPDIRPTNMIREIAFSQHELDTDSVRGSTVMGSVKPDTTVSFIREVAANFRKAAELATASNTFAEVFAGPVNVFNEYLRVASPGASGTSQLSKAPVLSTSGEAPTSFTPALAAESSAELNSLPFPPVVLQGVVYANGYPLALSAADATKTVNTGGTGVLPELIRLQNQLVAIMADKGYKVSQTPDKTGGFRTSAQQQAIFAQGRTTPGKVVTHKNGVTEHSPHEFGAAFDMVFIVDGKPSWADQNPWALLGATGQGLGLVWGGTFKDLRDLGHFELPKYQSLQRGGSAHKINPATSFAKLHLKDVNPVTSATVASQVGKDQSSNALASYTLRQAWELAADAAAAEICRQYQISKGLWPVDGATKSNLDNVMSSLYGAPATSSESATEAVTVPSNIKVSSPVLPVSDSRGYEVVGTFRYGRDVNIDPSGVFDMLHKADPLSLVDRKAAEDYVNALLNADGIYAKNLPRTAAGTDAISENKLLEKAVPLDKATQNLLAQLHKRGVPDSQILELGGQSGKDAKNPAVLQNALRNWIANKSNDGLQKVPVVNAGYSLADLDLHTGRGACTCRAAEADVLLSMAGRTEFVAVATGTAAPASGDRDTDELTQWVIDASTRATGPWAASRRAISGVVPDSTATSVVSAASTTLQEWEQDAIELTKRRDALQASLLAATNPTGGNG